MFGTRSVGLLQYVTSTTLPHIPEISGAPSPPPPGHKSHKNDLTVKSETWRRLESIYQIDTVGFARQVVAWTMANIQDVPFKLEDPHSVEKLSLVTRRRDGLPHKIDHPIDTIDRLGAFLDILPLKSAQRLFHMLYPDTLDWKFILNQAYDPDQNVFEYFLWARTLPGNDQGSIALVIAYQPPWILSQADFTEFAKCSSFPPFIAPGHAYPSELQSKHRIWAKLWDTCVQHNTKWFILTSWNVWAFGGFSDGWCSGYISDIWHLDEHTPTVLECVTFWISSAMECEDGYHRPKVPEPVDALQAETVPPASQTDTPTPAVSESSWKGKTQDASISAHVTSVSILPSHHGLEDYIPPPIEREQPVKDNFICEWLDSVGNSHGDNGDIQNSRRSNDRTATGSFHGDWLI